MNILMAQVIALYFLRSYQVCDKAKHTVIVSERSAIFVDH